MNKRVWILLLAVLGISTSIKILFGLGEPYLVLGFFSIGLGIILMFKGQEYLDELLEVKETKRKSLNSSNPFI